MSNLIRTIRLTAGAVLLGGLLAGCGTTPPPKYYSLQPISTVYSNSNRAGYDKGLRIRVGPVVTPRYLDHSQIAVVTGGPEVYFSDSNRWASPVEDNISRILIQNLGSLLSTCRIVPFPGGQDVAVDYTVEVQFNRFDGAPGGKSILDVQWEVTASGESIPCAIRSALLEEQVRETTYASLVEAESVLLGQLSRRIADDIRSVSKTSESGEPRARP